MFNRAQRMTVGSVLVFALTFAAGPALADDAKEADGPAPAETPAAAIETIAPHSNAVLIEQRL